MKRKMHFFASAAVFTLLFIVAQAGFAGGSSDKGKGGATGVLDTSKRVELTLYIIGNEPPKQAELYENFNRIALEKLNCTLKTIWLTWGEYRNKYPLIFSSGEAFDMAYAATWLNFPIMAQKGAFKQLDELFPQYAPKNYARQSATAKRQGSVGGHIYGIPTLQATYGVYGAIYRADLATAHGWDGKMETFEDMERYFEIIKKNYPAMEPIQILSEGSNIDDAWMMNRGFYHSKGGYNDFMFLDPSQANPKLFTYYEYDKIQEFLSMIVRWNERGYFPKSALSDTDNEKVQNGKAALRLHNIDTYDGIYRARPDWDIRWCNFVKDVSHNAFTNDVLVIPSTAKNPERALALWELITNDEEAFRAFFYGVEGKSYELVKNGNKTSIRAINITDYAFSNMWAARTNEFYLPIAGAPADLQGYKDGYESRIKEGVGTEKFRSFNIDTSSIENEYAACLAVHQQYWWPLELAYVDVVKGLAEYQEKMKAAGIDKVKQVVQAQLDAYVASLK
ncbi:ABC transporter substrate-binding protein [Spirochaetia bacterium]|nr:ABC transporter substrate-binding protein [Spirochaetia bacterium]